MKNLSRLTIGLLALAVPVLTANAWHLDGNVKCPNGLVFKGVVITITGVNCYGTNDFWGSTDTHGQYTIPLPDCPGTYTACIDTTTLPPDATVNGPTCIDFALTDDNNNVATINWEINGDACERGGCWFTGGGNKIDSILGIPVAEKGQKNNFGGNVYPGCNSTSGGGGNWNHVARDLKLHFQGKDIQVVRCGNVDPPHPPGSTSPVTPFNFLECVGTGTLKGIQGNKVDYGEVTFFARFEDRNEPGAKEGNAGAYIDQYFLKVVDGGGVTRLLIDNDGIDDGNVDPTVITGGNFQIHNSSCDNPPNF